MGALIGFLLNREEKQQIENRLSSQSFMSLVSRGIPLTFNKNKINKELNVHEK